MTNNVELLIEDTNQEISKWMRFGNQAITDDNVENHQLARKEIMRLMELRKHLRNFLN